ncbi:aminocarboxymuconate-semialdehyde decarboxylase [Palleronia marisminoris]|uniref:amidohydrolase family protein n=1 Tax=Palleronia marisminoris TaxID=315423 RepID=UPI0008E879A9|nr:amidohydrolase family protein [Palleronia marisminoris]SFH27416.1 aminocarboxymuconate-semialdehyde decarboxylase [Palleronia marisminoris]
MKKIDVFNHIWPKPFYDALIDHIGEMTDITMRSGKVPMMTDLDRRFEVMDQFGPDYCQILSLASPPYEKYADPAKALELARIASDSMADLCRDYPARFPGFIGTAVMSNTDALVAETRYNIEELGAVGMQIFTNVSGKPLDAPEFEPFFEYMASAGKPVWLHPARGANFPDYLSEEQSEYEIWWTFGWPYETSAAMARLVFSGHFDRHPGLNVITHHAGGMVPFFEGRVGPGWDQMGARTSDRDLAAVRKGLKRPHLEYFKEFYADTASFGSAKAIAHAMEFFGEDRVLFASDAPFDPEGGPMYIRETIKVIDGVDLTQEQRKKLYQDNAVELLGLKL